MIVLFDFRQNSDANCALGDDQKTMITILTDIPRIKQLRIETMIQMIQILPHKIDQPLINDSDKATVL